MSNVEVWTRDGLVDADDATALDWWVASGEWSDCPTCLNDALLELIAHVRELTHRVSALEDRHATEGDS